MRKATNAKKAAQLSPSNTLPDPRDDQSTHGWPALFGCGFVACCVVLVVVVCNMSEECIVCKSCVGFVFCNWFAIAACESARRLTYPAFQLQRVETKLNSMPSVRITRDAQRAERAGARVFEWGRVRRASRVSTQGNSAFFCVTMLNPILVTDLPSITIGFNKSYNDLPFWAFMFWLIMFRTGSTQNWIIILSRHVGTGKTWVTWGGSFTRNSNIISLTKLVRVRQGMRRRRRRGQLAAARAAAAAGCNRPGAQEQNYYSEPVSEVSGGLVGQWSGGQQLIDVQKSITWLISPKIISGPNGNTWSSS